METLTDSIQSQFVKIELTPNEVVAIIRGDPQVISTERIGLLYHRPKVEPKVSVSVKNSTSNDVHVTLNTKSDESGWRDDWLKWRRPNRIARLLEGGDSVEAQDSILPDGSIRLFVKSHSHREADLIVRVPADGETYSGRYLYEIEARVEGSSDSQGVRVSESALLRIERPDTTLLEHLPSIYREAMLDLRSNSDQYDESPFFERYLLGFEDVLTPLRETLNSLDQLFGPFSTPSYLVLWLATWVTMPMDENWPEMDRRKLVREAVELFRWRGTARGLSRFLEIFTGFKPEIEDHPIYGMRLGTLAQLGTTGAILGDIGPHTFVVTIAVPDPSAVNQAMVRDIIDYVKPAHTAYVLRLVSRPQIVEATN